MSSNKEELLARVIGEEKNHYRVQVGRERTAHATVSGRLQYHARSRRDFPAVGDWVVCEETGDPERLVISQIKDRKGTVERASSGATNETQIVATNVDWIFIATSANEDLNFRRLDRYVAMAWSSNAQPVILLTKGDLADDATEVAREIEERFIGVPVHILKALSDDPRPQLATYLKPGSTCVVVGSSGVGKSTLVNRLLGEELLATKAIRESDGRGRHTTTSRYLFELDGRWTIDGSVRKNIARYINHSCRPNAESDVKPRKRTVHICAIRNIPARAPQGSSPGWPSPRKASPARGPRLTRPPKGFGTEDASSSTEAHPKRTGPPPGRVRKRAGGSKNAGPS